MHPARAGGSLVHRALLCPILPGADPQDEWADRQSIDGIGRGALGRRICIFWLAVRPGRQETCHVARHGGGGPVVLAWIPCPSCECQSKARRGGRASTRDCPRRSPRLSFSI